LVSKAKSPLTGISTSGEKNKSVAIVQKKKRRSIPFLINRGKYIYTAKEKKKPILCGKKRKEKRRGHRERGM